MPSESDKITENRAIHLTRIKDSMRKLEFYSEEDIEKMAHNRTFQFVLGKDSLPKYDSDYYDFKKKVNVIVDHFKDDGVTTYSFLKSAKKYPQLLYQSPQTIINNVEQVIGYFKDNGLLQEGYLKAAVKVPSLFYQNPKTVIGNIESVVSTFKNNGLTLNSYLKAASKSPTLFSSSPARIISNVKEVVKAFNNEDLSIDDYLKAALKQPSLFSISSQKIRSNIEQVANNFKEDGLTVKSHLKNALKQPSLFYQSPETISGHINLFKKLYEKGRITVNHVPFDAKSSTPYQPLYDCFSTQPSLLCRSDLNIQLRNLYVAIFPEYESTAKPFREPKRVISQEIMSYFGHSNVNGPIPKIYDLEALANDVLSESEKESQTKNLLHRSMIRANLLPGQLEAQSESSKYTEKTPSKSIKPESSDLIRNQIGRSKID